MENYPSVRVRIVVSLRVGGQFSLEGIVLEPENIARETEIFNSTFHKTKNKKTGAKI